MIPRKWLECRCTSPDHAVRVSLHSWGSHSSDVELIIEPRIQLARIGFFRRVWYALKIVFGQQPNMYAEAILDHDAINELSALIVRYRLLTKLRKAREQKSRKV